MAEAKRTTGYCPICGQRVRNTVWNDPILLTASTVSRGIITENVLRFEDCTFTTGVCSANGVLN